VNFSASALAVKEATKSPWTACVSDVATGHADLCVSDIWETADRRKMADFITPFSTESFYLWTASKSSRDYTTMFHPFSNHLWVALVALYVVLQGTIVLLERDNVLPAVCTAKLDTLPKKKKDPKDGCMGLFHNDIWGEGLNITTTEGRVLNFLVGIFYFIVATCYTANLVSAVNVNGAPSEAPVISLL
jgi:hypothetical protein